MPEGPNVAHLEKTFLCASLPSASTTVRLCHLASSCAISTIMSACREDGSGSSAPVASPAKVAALAAFREHADATNDIFHLAAKVVAGTLLDAESVLEQYPAQGD